MKLGRTLTSLALAALTISGAATVAHAEPPTGSRMGNRIKKVENASFRDPYVIAYRVSRCAAALKRPDVRRIMDATTAEARDAARKNVIELRNCNASYLFGGEAEYLSYSIDQVVQDGMYGEAVLIEDKAGRDLPALPMQRDYTRPWFAVSGRKPVLNETAVCLSDIAPAKVFALFKTKIASREEMSATQAMGGELGQCVPAGIEMRLEPRTLRSALGEAMYHRVYDQPAVAAAAAGGA